MKKFILTLFVSFSLVASANNFSTTTGGFFFSTVTVEVAPCSYSAFYSGSNDYVETRTVTTTTYILGFAVASTTYDVIC